MLLETTDESVQALPLVSVIVPVHNGERTLPSCLEAIVRSDYPRYEIVVVDDSSTDSSVAVAEGFPCRVLRASRQAGAAAARNLGALQGKGEILFFTDSDVIIRPDTLSRVVRHLLDHPWRSAVFGSYTADTEPANFFSVYKNLVHHYTHQNGKEEAGTFWAGCGALWSEAFHRVGGFDPSDTASADVEDIALGYRLMQQGCRIGLAREIQVTHCKHYTFVGLLKSDIFHRAVPWTRLMLSQKVLRNDLNTKWENLASTVLTFALFVSLGMGVLDSLYLLLCPVWLLGVVYLNRGLLGVFLAHHGPVFALKAIPMILLFYTYCPLGSALGLSIVLIRGLSARVGAPLANGKPRVAGKPGRVSLSAREK